MKVKVTILDRDKNSPVDSYETEKEGEEYDRELLEFKGKIAQEYRIPFKFQLVRRDMIGMFLIMCMIGMISCRTVKRTSSRADSTAIRTVETGTKWETEVVTEFIPFQQPVSTVDNQVLPLSVLTTYPVFAGSTKVQPVQPYRVVKKTKVQESLPVQTPAGYYRQTVRTKGEQHSALAEAKTASIEEKEKEMETGFSTNPIFTGFQIGMIVGVLAVVVIVVGIYKRT